MIKYLRKSLNDNSIKIFSFLNTTGITNITRKYLYKKYFIPKAQLKITDLYPLSKPISLINFMLTTPELHKSNDWYGHATIIKKLAGINNNYAIKAAIEHGADFSPPSDIDIRSRFPVMITFGENSYNYQSSKNKKIYTIGPFIHYATHYLNKNQLMSEKKRLGTNLLVFPSHSTSISNTHYDIKALCSKIKTIEKNFDSIRICLYWREIVRGLHHDYLKNGYECVTAGHIFDPQFLPRLKSIIDMATITMSNSIGTHIGYCIYMNKPHYFFDQEVSYNGVDNEELELIKTINKSEVFKKIKNAFMILRNNITQSQRELINYYWGLDQIKTKYQLKMIIDEAEILYKKSSSFF
jgi:hypothetical protein